MKIGVPKEILPGETRVAASPDSVKKFTALGVEMLIESGAVLNSGHFKRESMNEGRLSCK